MTTLIDQKTFEKIQYSRNLLAAIENGEKEIEEGKFIEHESLFEELYKQFNEKL